MGCDVNAFIAVTRADHRPQYAVFPEDKGGFAIDDQYYVGDSGILVKPVTKEGATSTEIYIADNQVSVHRQKSRRALTE